MSRWLRRHIVVSALSLLVVASGLVGLLHTQPVHAATCGPIETVILSGDLCAGAATSDSEAAKDSSKSPLVSILLFALNILTILVGIAAIGALIYAGILYASAGGNASQISTAKDYIKNTVIGLICFAGMLLAMSFLIPGGVVGPGGITIANGIPSGGPLSLTDSGNGSSIQLKKKDDGDDEQTTDSANNPFTTLKMTIGSWNIYKYGKSQNAVSGVSTLMKEKGVDILGIQEAQGDNPAIRKKLGSGYGVWPTSKKQPRNIAIVWNKSKFNVVDKGHFMGVWQQRSNERVSREFTWIKFKSKQSNKVFYVINTQAPDHQYSKSGSKWKVTGHYYKTYIRALTSKLKSKFLKDDVPIFIVGDLNFNARRDSCTTYTPCKELDRNLDIKSGWDYTKFRDVPSWQGTIKSSSAIIDYVSSWDRSYITYHSMKILTSNKTGWSGSDHKPIALSLTIGASNE